MKKKPIVVVLDDGCNCCSRINHLVAARQWSTISPGLEPFSHSVDWKIRMILAAHYDESSFSGLCLNLFSLCIIILSCRLSDWFIMFE